MDRTQRRNGALLGVLFAAGTFVILLAAHVTPGGYHGHRRYVAPHSYASRPSPTAPAPGTASASADNSNHAGSAGLSIALLLAVAAVLLVTLLAATILARTVGLPGHWGYRWRPPVPAAPTFDRAAADLARQLTQAVDAGIDDLADGPVSDAIVDCWLRLRDAALAAGVAPSPADTPEEFVSRVLTAAHVRPEPLHELAQLYREARFSVHQMTDADRGTARAALHEVGAGLQAGAHG